MCAQSQTDFCYRQEVLQRDRIVLVQDTEETKVGLQHAPCHRLAPSSEDGIWRDAHVLGYNAS